MQFSIQDKQQWSANADSYAKGAQHLSNAPVDLLFTQMDCALPFSAARAILDVGSGPGVTMRRLIESYGSQFPTSVRLIASDFSTGMIEQVKKLQKQEYGNRPIWSQVEAKVLDAHVLDGIENASISHITGTMVYNLVANGRQALEAAYRVLQPAGVIGMTLGAGAELMELMGLAAKKIRGKKAPTYQYPEAYGTADGIREEFALVGFSADFVETVDSFIDVSNPEPLVHNFLRSNNPGAMFFVGDYSKTELDAFVNEVLGLIEEKHTELPRKINGQMIVAVGRKMG